MTPKMNEEMHPLLIKRYKLEEEINNLQTQKEELTLGAATMQFLITDLSEGSYKDIIKPMSEHNYQVTLGVSLKNMPGLSGNISLENMKKLSLKNWKLCYSFEKNEIGEYHKENPEALSLWLDSVDNEIKRKGFSMSNAIYFPAGTFKKEYISVLKEHNIEVIIHSGDIDKKQLVAEYEDDMWYVCGIWWRGNEIIASKMSSIQKVGGEFVTIIGADRSATNSLQDWLAQFEGKRGNVTITDFDTMVKIQSNNRQLGIKEAETINAEISKLTVEIGVINSEITKIQRKYTHKIQMLR